jgi:hypothetical protein
MSGNRFCDKVLSMETALLGKFYESRSVIATTREANNQTQQSVRGQKVVQPGATTIVNSEQPNRCLRSLVDTGHQLFIHGLVISCINYPKILKIN